jgi:hypothetical protein
LQFINNYNEVMTGDDFESETLYGTTIIEQVIRIDQIVSEPELKALKPKSRKCLFPSEPNTKYFNVVAAKCQLAAMS